VYCPNNEQALSLLGSPRGGRQKVVTGSRLWLMHKQQIESTDVRLWVELTSCSKAELWLMFKNNVNCCFMV
jgi:hypothetical protein